MIQRSAAKSKCEPEAVMWKPAPFISWIVGKSVGKAIDSHCLSTPENCQEGREILLVTLWIFAHNGKEGLQAHSWKITGKSSNHLHSKTKNCSRYLYKFLLVLPWKNFGIKMEETYWSYQDTFIGSADILAIQAMVLSSLQWTMRTQVKLALSLGKIFAVYWDLGILLNDNDTET